MKTVENVRLYADLNGISFLTHSFTLTKPSFVYQEAAFEVNPSLSLHIQPIGNIVTLDEDAAIEGMLTASHQLDSNVLGCATETIQDQVQVRQVAVSPLKSEKISKKRGWNSVIEKDIVQTDLSKLPRPDGEKTSESLVSEANVRMEVLEAHHNDSSMDTNVPEKSCDFRIHLSPKAVEKNVISLGSSSQTPEMIRRSEQPVSVQEVTSHQPSERKTFDEPNDSDTLQVSEKVTPDELGDASKFVSSNEVKNEQDIEGDSHLGITKGTLRSKKRGRPRKVIC